MYIRVKVLAGVKKELVKEIGENRLEIHVKEPAMANLANKRINRSLWRKISVSRRKR